VTAPVLHQLAPAIVYLTAAAPSHDDLWKTLGPPIIAAIVPGAAILVTWLQSRRSAKLAEAQLALSGRQLDASNDMQRRQGDMRAHELELMEAKQVHDMRADLYEGWKEFDGAAWALRAAYMNFHPMTPEKQQHRSECSRVFDAAQLKMRFLFADDVVGSIDKLGESFQALFISTSHMASPYKMDGVNSDVLVEQFSRADNDVTSQIDAVREAVRLYTVHGLKKP
jgi:hypothetical protein